MTEEQLRSKHENLGMDCFIAVAVIGGVGLASAGLGAATSLTAAGEQSSAANNAANLQEQQFQQNQANQQPFIQGGQQALGTIQSDQANGTGFASPFTQASFMSNPGYQFQLQQGQNAIQSAAAAQGGALNGGTLKALDQYTTGLANTTYNQAYQNYLQTSNQQYNQLLGVAGLGESAASGLGAQGTQSANNAGNYLTQAGSATAAGTLGAGTAASSGLGSLGLLGLAGLQQGASQSGYSPVGSVTWNGGGSGPLNGNYGATPVGGPTGPAPSLYGGGY